MKNLPVLSVEVTAGTYQRQKIGANGKDFRRRIPQHTLSTAHRLLQP
jgi:hypothetical protein